MTLALKSGYGRKFRLGEVTEYEKGELLALLGKQIEANRRVVAPYVIGTAAPPYEQAAAVRMTARLLGDQLREWIRIQGNLDAAERAEGFREIRQLRGVIIKAGRVLAKGPPPKDTSN
jgi:hypothetical protein